jgi:hypothetical protein
MRRSLAGLLAVTALLAPRSADAQLRDQLYSVPLAEAPRDRTPDAAAPSPSLRPPRAPAPRPMLQRRASTGWLVAGGALGGGVGTIVGMGVGALVDGPADDDCIDFCFGPGLVFGTLAGEVLGIAAGVHLANGRGGSLPMDALASAGILVVGGWASGGDELLLVVPVGQIFGAIVTERATTRR